MNPCSLSRDEGDSYNQFQCKGCNGPKLGLKSVDVRLESAKVERPLSFVSGGFPGIALKELLFQLSAECVARDLYLGQVFGPNGKLLEEWATFHGRHRVIIRGTKNAGERICDVCGRVVYFAMGKNFLYPEPPADAEAFESDLAGLVLREEQYSRLNLSKWRKPFYVEELRVKGPAEL